MAFGPPQVVEGLPRVNLPFGLFSVLSLRGSEDERWSVGGIQWEAMTCSPASALVDPGCTEDPTEKFFRDMTEIGSATPFTVYGSARCGIPGSKAMQLGEESATAQLLAREEAQAEAVVWSFMAAEATDLNPAGALPEAEALAVLEGWMGRVYGSLGVIHGSRWAASLWSKRLESSGSKLFTRLGTPVSAGAGYPGSSPSGAAPAPGEEWVFASPALFGYRGSVFTSSAPDLTRNDYFALAERNYVIGFDPCGVGAVRLAATP